MLFRHPYSLPCLLLFLSLYQSAEAQPTVPADPGQKLVTIVRTDTPPVIDGELDDAVWENAAFFDGFHKVNPA